MSFVLNMPWSLRSILCHIRPPGRSSLSIAAKAASGS
jgi:hypothetical protein